ncbi:MAG: hypothetical protein QOG23_3447 [Blastocatellia bacterium]|jgi:hypothetical protein|nr:hypothetical protein [Blastocatellia bacterium]
MRLPILIIHICGGVVGLLSGIAAVSFRKGSPRHRNAGNIFFISMLTMASTAAYLGNVFGGASALYLVTTGWLTARRREGQTSIFDWGALLFGLAVGVPIVTDGLRIVSGSIPPKPGVPVGMILFLGSVVLLAAAGDVRMLVRGGVFGRQRIARHLWRMCFGLFIATGSFLAQRRVLAFLGGPKIMLLAALPLIVMIFWLIRVRFKNAYKGKSVPGSGEVHPLPT